MMKKMTIAAILILLLTLGITACKSATSYSNGNVTVGLTGADTINGNYLYAYVYAEGETEVNNPGTVIACGKSEAITSSGIAGLTLMVDNGSFEPTGTGWTGTGGVTYDIYIYTDDSDNSPTEDTAFMTVPMPMQITIDGDYEIDILFGDMDNYKVGSGA